ncbi:hypothetical protein N9R79_07285 [Vibrio sp.]|nr:hypothetical protein [Vibrio sp.]
MRKLKFLGFILDTKEGVLHFGDQFIQLSHQESMILSLIIRSGKDGIKRDVLYQKIQSDDQSLSKTSIKSHIHKIRKSISFLDRSNDSHLILMTINNDIYKVNHGSVKFSIIRVLFFIVTLAVLLLLSYSLILSMESKNKHESNYREDKIQLSYQSTGDLYEDNIVQIVKLGFNRIVNKPIIVDSPRFNSLYRVDIKFYKKKGYVLASFYHAFEDTAVSKAKIALDDNDEIPVRLLYFIVKNYRLDRNMDAIRLAIHSLPAIEKESNECVEVGVIFDDACPLNINDSDRDNIYAITSLLVHYIYSNSNEDERFKAVLEYVKSNIMNDPFAIDAMSLYYLKQLDYDTAIKYQDTRSNNDRSYVYYLVQGKIYESLHRKTFAFRHYVMALRYASNKEEEQYILSLIENVGDKTDISVFSDLLLYH